MLLYKKDAHACIQNMETFSCNRNGMCKSVEHSSACIVGDISFFFKVLTIKIFLQKDFNSEWHRAGTISGSLKLVLVRT